MSPGISLQSTLKSFPLYVNVAVCIFAFNAAQPIEISLQKESPPETLIVLFEH